jgi:predicted RNA-binding Zn ribbon-like protein
MPARLCVESGISAGTTFWIDRAVMRIGSDPQCDVCLPSAELPPHALTLEFRDGNYRAYNRSPSPVSVGASLVEPGANAIWRAGETVHLPGDLRVSLSVDGDPRPTPRPEAHLEDRFDDAASMSMDAAAADAVDEVAAKKSKSSLIQLAIIGICVAAIGGLLLMKNSGGTEKAAPDRPTFNELVHDSLTKDDPHRNIIRHLQYAQAALVRGNAKLAHQRFADLRDQLVQHVENLSGDDRAEVVRILSYVEYRLGQL